MCSSDLLSRALFIAYTRERGRTDGKAWSTAWAGARPDAQLRAFEGLYPKDLSARRIMPAPVVSVHVDNRQVNRAALEAMREVLDVEPTERIAFAPVAPDVPLPAVKEKVAVEVKDG